MVAEKSLVFPFLPSAALISRLNKSFNGILCLGLFDVVPMASNTGGIQTAGSWKGWTSTIVGVQSGSGVVPKMHIHRVLLLSFSPTHLSTFLRGRAAGEVSRMVAGCSEHWELNGTGYLLVGGQLLREWQWHVCPGSAGMSVSVGPWSLLAVLY